MIADLVGNSVLAWSYFISLCLIASLLNYKCINNKTACFVYMANIFICLEAYKYGPQINEYVWRTFGYNPPVTLMIYFIVEFLVMAWFIRYARGLYNLVVIPVFLMLGCHFLYFFDHQGYSVIDEHYSILMELFNFLCLLVLYIGSDTSLQFFRRFKRFVYGLADGAIIKDNESMVVK